jgi:hypothetical protein
LIGGYRGRATAAIYGWRPAISRGSTPKGTQGQKRPADTVQNAICVAKLLPGEAEEGIGIRVRRRGRGGYRDSGKDKAAQALGGMGGAARQASTREKGSQGSGGEAVGIRG